MEVLPVESAVVGSAPRYAGGRALGGPDAAQQTAAYYGGGLGVWREQWGLRYVTFLLQEMEAGRGMSQTSVNQKII